MDAPGKHYIMDYTNLTVEDLASNESFIHWVNQSDPEAVRYWDLYISTHPEIHLTVERARALVINLRLAEETRHDTARIDSMWDKIQDRVELEERPAVKTPVKAYRLVLASLIFLCFCVASWIVFQLTISESQSPDYAAYQDSLSDFIEQVNETDKPLEVKLADGSTVILESKSRLKYRANYQEADTRNVYLLGEAFFNVAKDPYKPFIVHTNDVFVKVLGTSFRVAAPENGKNIVVSVKTGKVSVYAAKDHADNNNKKDGVILTPNQQVSYERKEQLFEKTLVDAPEVLNKAIAQADFAFDNTPIAKAFKIMEEAYGIEIIFNEEVMKNCYITAPLGSEPMKEKIKIICQTIGATFEIIDARVVISSAGC